MLVVNQQLLGVGNDWKHFFQPFMMSYTRNLMTRCCKEQNKMMLYRDFNLRDIKKEAYANDKSTYINVYKYILYVTFCFSGSVHLRFTHSSIDVWRNNQPTSLSLHPWYITPMDVKYYLKCNLKSY